MEHSIELMRVLLQDTQTHLFFAGPGRWVKDCLDALNLESIQRAAQVYESEDFPFVEIIVENQETASTPDARRLVLERLPSP